MENNNISFIIALNKEPTNLFFYYYNFNLTKEINESKIIKFNDMNIQNKKIRCEINYYSTFIICFYYSILNAKNNFVSTIFQIKNMNLYKEKTSTKIVSHTINEIKVATSYNNNFFVCFLVDTTAVCLINDNLYKFNEIQCRHNSGWSNAYKVLYFRETDDFMLISRTFLTTTILNNHNNNIKKCNKNILTQQSEVYSIIL